MGIGQSFNTFTPFMMPQTPFFMGQAQFNMPQFNMTQFNMTQFNMTQIPFCGMLFPFGFSSSKSETTEEAEKRRKKEEAERDAAELAQRMEKIKQQQENEIKLHAQIQDIEKAKKEIDITIQNAEKGKVSEDGTIKTQETWSDYTKLPWWKKGLRAAGAIFLDAPMKLAEGFVGYEKNEKTGEHEWNWKKCLRNAAIAAGCVALTAIPVAGPVISAGLLATGAIFGVVGTGKGVINAINAANEENPEALEQAFQDIGTGVLIGAASIAGLRGLGKSAQVTAATNSSTSSAVQTSWKTSVTNYFKDATVNAYKATAQSVKAQQTSVAANGFWNTFVTNLKAAVPFGKSKFEKASYETNQSINTRLNEINQELNSSNISPLKKALLEQEKLVLDAQKTELRNAVTKESWNALKTNSEVHKDIKTLQSAVNDIKTNGSITIDGNTYNMSKENLKTLQEALSRSKEMSKEIQNLVKVRKSTIKQMASMKKHKSDVEAYTGQARNNRIGRLYDTIKVNKSDLTWKKALMSPLKFAWEAMMLAWKPWNSLKNSAATTVYKAEETIAPSYTAGFLSSGFIAEAMNMGDKTITTKIAQQTQDGQTIEQEVAVTKDVLAQLKEQKQQLDQALLNAQNEMSKIYTA